MTSELPSSAGGFTLSPAPEARKFVGTKKRIRENELSGSAKETSSQMVQVKLELLIPLAYSSLSHPHGKSGDHSH